MIRLVFTPKPNQLDIQEALGCNNGKMLLPAIVPESRMGNRAHHKMDTFLSTTQICCSSTMVASVVFSSVSMKNQSMTEKVHVTASGDHFNLNHPTGEGTGRFHAERGTKRCSARGSGSGSKNDRAAHRHQLLPSFVPSFLARPFNSHKGEQVIRRSVFGVSWKSNLTLFLYSSVALLREWALPKTDENGSHFVRCHFCS